MHWPCTRYSLLHLAGYDSVAMDDLKQFRRLTMVVVVRYCRIVAGHRVVQGY